VSDGPDTAVRPWYADGLRFACQRSGNCCTGEPGTVRLTDAEIRVLAGRLGLKREAFEAIYTRRLPSGAISLRERPNHDCVFYDAAFGCEVYSQRPRQCRTWPFWRALLSSPEEWEKAARSCPGMNRGPVHDLATLRRLAAEDGTSGELPASEKR
jgi:Fe-S-cluster containining protein